jgi:hypothetical protein
MEEICSSPRLRLFRPVSRPVCGFGVSGSASLCVAQQPAMCGVFVQLHLALFSAGGPFLPSLSVNTYIFCTMEDATTRRYTCGGYGGWRAHGTGHRNGSC